MEGATVSMMLNGLEVLFEDPTFHGERHVSEGDGGEVALILFFVDIAEHREFLACAGDCADQIHERFFRQHSPQYRLLSESDP